MARTERVTVTLPEEVVREVDRHEQNRSRFVLQAIQHELERRRRDASRRSIEHPPSVTPSSSPTNASRLSRLFPSLAHQVKARCTLPFDWVPAV